MRFPRVKAEGRSFYHCISRVVEGRLIFGTSGDGGLEAERFVTLMRRLEAFSGVRVLTYVLMANHFHLLCEVPEPRPLSQSEVLERIQAGYGPSRVQALKEQLARFAEQPDALEQCNRLLEPYRKRMNDLSIFIKELKGRFAQITNLFVIAMILLQGRVEIWHLVMAMTLGLAHARWLCNQPRDVIDRKCRVGGLQFLQQIYPPFALRQGQEAAQHSLTMNFTAP